MVFLLNLAGAINSGKWLVMLLINSGVKEQQNSANPAAGSLAQLSPYLGFSSPSYSYVDPGLMYCMGTGCALGPPARRPSFDRYPL